MKVNVVVAAAAVADHACDTAALVGDGDNSHSHRDVVLQWII